MNRISTKQPKTKIRSQASSKARTDLPIQLRHFEERREAMIATVRELVEIESPSDCKPAVDKLGQHLANKFSSLGGKIKFHVCEAYGNHLQVDFPGPGERVLLLGHMDTVYPVGTLATMPCKVADGRIWGPGSFDMKGGIALMLFAIEAVQAQRGELRATTVLLVADEEIGSNSSRAITESLATNSAAVLVFEPAAGLKGAVKTARKGVGEYKLRVSGVSAHAGLDPGKGHSAIIELAKQIERIAGFNDLKRGLSANVGVIQGGSRTNVVAAEAIASIDVRIATAKDAAHIDRKMRSLKAFDRHCTIEVTGGINRLPMERTDGVLALYRRATAIAEQLGWNLGEAAVGGGSDGNFTAGLGIPTLDGLGAVGEGAHAVHESILLSELPKRATLISNLIANI